MVFPFLLMVLMALMVFPFLLMVSFFLPFPSFVSVNLSYLCFNPSAIWSFGSSFRHDGFDGFDGFPFPFDGFFPFPFASDCAKSIRTTNKVTQRTFMITDPY